MEENKEAFTYAYSAKQQEEIRNIRQRYVSNEEDKMAKLRKLDKSVTTPGTIIGIAVGIIGTLVFGLGMTCVLEWHLVGIGILVGIVGCIGIGAAYPIYALITKKQKEKLTPIIMSLIDELTR